MFGRLVFWAAAIAGAAIAASAVAGEEGFVKLFNGQDLTGWEGDKTVFRVEDGAIVGGSLKKGLPDNQFLATTREYKNFELRAKCKLAGKRANGGIQIRSQRVPNSSEMKGYQADMDENFWGNLYDESNRNKILAGPTKEERARSSGRTAGTIM